MGVEALQLPENKRFSHSPDPSLDPTSPAVENLAAEILPAELRYPGATPWPASAHPQPRPPFKHLP